MPLALYQAIRDGLSEADLQSGNLPVVLFGRAGEILMVHDNALGGKDVFKNPVADEAASIRNCVTYGVEDNERLEVVDGIDPLNLSGEVRFEIECHTPAGVRNTPMTDDAVGDGKQISFPPHTLAEKVLARLHRDGTLLNIYSDYDEPVDREQQELDYYSHVLLVGIKGSGCEVVYDPPPPPMPIDIMFPEVFATGALAGVADWSGDGESPAEATRDIRFERFHGNIYTKTQDLQIDPPSGTMTGVLSLRIDEVQNVGFSIC